MTAKPANEMPELLPCPFCKEGETIVKENHHSPTMSGGIKEPISVDITHWCKGDGLPRTRVMVTGRNRQEAITAYNTRALTPSQSQSCEAVGREWCMKHDREGSECHGTGDVAKAVEWATIALDVLRERLADKGSVQAIEALETLIRASQQSSQRSILSDAPCDKCGYNGVGYYQPDTHPCAKAHHAAQHPSPDLLQSHYMRGVEDGMRVRGEVQEVTVMSVEEFVQIVACEVGSPYALQASGLAALIMQKHPNGLIIKEKKA